MRRRLYFCTEHKPEFAPMKRNGRQDPQQETQTDELPEFDFGDIGIDTDLDIDPDGLDLSGLDILDEAPEDITRYTMPKVYKIPADFVMYDNAEKLARELRLDKYQRSDVIISGAFIFGDFIEAYMTTWKAATDRMVISTLSLSQNNVDSLANLMEAGYIGRLDMIVSVYFWSHERYGLIPYIYRKLDKDDRFQLAVAGVHTKTVHFETRGGRKIVIHGSANLRSSGSIEQFTIEENPDLFYFYTEQFYKILEKYQTINKAVRNADLWDIMTRKRL